MNEKETNGQGPGVAGDAGMSQVTTPLDRIVCNKMATCARRGRGFILDLAESSGTIPPEDAVAILEGEGANTGSRRGLTIRVVEDLAPVDNYERPTKYRDHEIHDADSMVVYAKKYGGPEKSLIVYNDDKVVLSIDEQKEIGLRELATLDFAYSDDWKAWSQMFALPRIDHRSLLKHLILFQHNMVDVILLDKMRTIRATATVKQNSDLKLDSNQVGVIFEANAGDELIQFPRKFSVKMPVLDLDVAAETSWQLVDVRVEVMLPTNPNEHVGFQLIAPKLVSVRRSRINVECGKIREQLPEWTIVRGEHAQVDRPVGRPNKSA